MSTFFNKVNLNTLIFLLDMETGYASLMEE